MKKKPTTTIRDVAKKAGVSPITVSRVINQSGYVREDVRRRVEAAIDALDYIPNALSQSLRLKKTNTIALLVADITNPFWTIVARGVEDVLNQQGLNVILCNTDEKPGKFDNYVNVLLQRRIDGFLLTPTEDTAPIIRRIQKQHVPLVVLDRLVPDVQVDIVRGDSEGGAYQLTKYLIDAGHTWIAMLAGPLTISTSSQRVDGYKRAFLESELPVDERLILSNTYTREGGYQMTTQLFETVQPPPTAIFAGNNLIAWGVLNKLHEIGWHVPEDISVVSFDDLPFLPYFKPFLTVVAQSPYDLGARAAEMLIDIITGKEKPDHRDVIMPVQLIVRDSCRPLNPGA